MKVKVDIDLQTFVRFFLVCGGFILAGYLIMRLSSPLTIIFLSFFLAIALNPPVSRLATLIPGHSRILATAISYIIVLTVLGGLMVVLVPPVIKQSVDFAQQVPGYIEVLQDRNGPLYKFLQDYNLEAQLDEAVGNAQNRASDFAQQLGGALVSGASSVFNGVITIGTILILAFMMLIEGPSWMRRIWSIYVDEDRRDEHKMLANRMYHVITAYVNGQLLIAFIAALASLVIMLLLSTFIEGVSAGVVLPLAAVVLVTSMIPMVGATLGGIIVTLALLFSDVSAALIFAAYFIIYQQVENNVIQPIVQSKSVDLSALGVIIAVLLGISLAGLVGGLVAIPLAGCLKIVFMYFLEQRKKKADRQPDNVLHKVKKAFASKEKSAEA